MKLGILTFISAVISIFLLIVFKLELWEFILIFMPLYLIMTTYFTAWYNMNGKIQPKAIPPAFEGRNYKAEQISPEIQQLGFYEIDRFYLPIIPDVNVYAFKHNTLPVFFCFYDFGTRQSCDFFSRYNNDISLTTTNTKDGGTLPRPVKAMLQIFPGYDYAQLFEQQTKAHRFLLNNGITALDLHKNEFRTFFMKSFADNWTYLKKHPLWPIPTIFRSVARVGIKHLKPIEKQWPVISPKIFKITG